MLLPEYYWPRVATATDRYTQTENRRQPSRQKHDGHDEHQNAAQRRGIDATQLLFQKFLIVSGHHLGIHDKSRFHLPYAIGPT